MSETMSRTLTKEGSPTSLGELSGLIGYHIAQAWVVSNAAFERHIAGKFGLRKVEFSLLALLMANGPLPPKRLAPVLALSAPNVTLLLDRMEQRELVRREPNPRDGRSQYIVLTDAGRRTAMAAARAAASMEQELNSGLTHAEHAMLIELLCKLARRPVPEQDDDGLITRSVR
jgi:DNA-binding MarR family transcriptional regulator